MAFAADQTRFSAQSDARDEPISRFIWHHQAGTNDDVTINMMVSGSKKVSATWTVDFEPPVGGALRNWARITAVVPEDRRPWTTASSLDEGALTVECANSSGSPSWDISDESHEACARLAAYAYQAHGVPLQRATAGNGWRGHMGHNEAPDTYATFCPGHLDIDYIIARGQQLVGTGLSGGALSEEDELMATADDIIKGVVDRLYPEIKHVQASIDGSGATDDYSTKQAVLPILQRMLGSVELTNSAAGQLLGRPVAGSSTASADPAEVAKLVVQMLGADLAAQVAPLLTVVAKDAA